VLELVATNYAVYSEMKLSNVTGCFVEQNFPCCSFTWVKKPQGTDSESWRNTGGKLETIFLQYTLLVCFLLHCNFIALWLTCIFILFLMCSMTRLVVQQEELSVWKNLQQQYQEIVPC